MKKYNVIVLAMGFLTVFSCKKDDKKDDPGTSRECLESPTTLSNEATCEELVSAFSDQICSAVDLGAFSLEDETYDYMPNYCISLNDKLTFVNSSGEKEKWQVTRKTFLNTRSIFSTNRRCSQDSTKVEAYCFKGDLATVTMRNERTLRSFILQLGVLVQEDNGQEAGAGDALFIVREVLPNQFQVEFNAVMSQQSLPFASYNNEEFYASIDLNGVTFSNVISNVPIQSQQPRFTYFYSKEEGFIGYKDLNGVIWVVE